MKGEDGRAGRSSHLEKARPEFTDIEIEKEKVQCSDGEAELAS